MRNLFGYGAMGMGAYRGGDFGMIEFFQWLVGVGILIWIVVGMLLIAYLWKLIMKN